MTWVLVCGLIALGLFLSAFFSGTETGLYCANRVRLQVKARQGDPSAVRLAAVLADEPGALTAMLLGVNVAEYLITYAVAYLLSVLLGLTDHEVEGYTVALVVPVVFVFTTVVPKNLFQLHPDRLLLAGSGILALADWIFRLSGAVWCLRTLSAWINRLTADPAVDLAAYDPKSKVALLLQETLVGKPHGREQTELIDRVLQLSEMSLQSVMVSAGRATVISASATREELIRIARTTSHSRLPVFSSNRRYVVGMADVDALLGSDDWQTVGERIEPALKLRPYDTIASAVAAMQSSGRKVAVVAEGNGPMLGIVTLRTLLELVVGGLGLGD